MPRQFQGEDVPLLHTTRFTMYELDNSGLVTLMLGSQGYRYKDRYTVDDIDHTDKSQHHISNLTAQFGVYKNNVLRLDGNVSYVRDDGLSFHSQEAVYNKKTTLFVSDTDFVAYRGKDTLWGTYIDHNDKTGKIHAKNIRAIYNLQK